jgi:hypothetical protein
MTVDVQATRVIESRRRTKKKRKEEESRWLRFPFMLRSGDLVFPLAFNGRFQGFRRTETFHYVSHMRGANFSSDAFSLLLFLFLP